MYIKLSALSLLFLLVACNSKEKPSIDSNATQELAELTMDSVLADTSKILVANLPFHFDSTQVLLHTIGFVEIKDRSSKSFDINIISKSDSYSDYDKDGYYFLSGKQNYSVSGNITNLFIEDLETNTSRMLTEKALNICHIQYLKEIAKKINKHYLLYTVYDKDYNNDKALNSLDIPALYISDLTGKNFTKLTQDYHKYDSGIFIPLNSKYYFRTVEDVNKDGYFDKKDKYHYYFVDLINNPYQAVAYNPMGFESN